MTASLLLNHWYFKNSRIGIYRLLTSQQSRGIEHLNFALNR